MTNARSIFTAVIICCASIVAVRGAHAQAPAVSSEAAPRNVVVLHAVGSDADRTALEASLRELLGRLALTLEVGVSEVRDVGRESPATPNVLAIAWVDLGSANRATLTLADGKSGRVVVNREVTRDRSSAVVVEEVAHIVQGSVEELAQIERDRATSPPSPSPSSAPPPPTPPTASHAAETTKAPPPERGARRIGVDAGAFAVGRGYGAGADLMFGGGLLLGLGYPRTRESRGPELWISGAYHAPIDATGKLVDAKISALSLRVAPTLEVVGGRAWRFELGPQGGVDVAWTSAESSIVPASRLQPQSTSAAPVVGALAIARFGVAPTADIFIAAMADVDLAPRRFVVREGSRTGVVFETWRVRPALSFGCTFELAGPSKYALAEAKP